MNEEQRKALVAEIVTEMSTIVEAKINNLVFPRLKQIQKDQDTMQKSMDRMDSDMGEDRKDIGDLKVHMGTIKDQFDEIKDLFSQQTRTLVHKMEDKIEKGIDTASEVMAETTGSAVEGVLENFVARKPLITKKTKSFFRFFKFWRLFKRGR